MGMSIAERNNKLKHYISCLKCEVSGKCCDDNCSTQYDAGNMGEIIENLEAVSKALEQEPKVVLALLEKTYADFCSCEGGEGWLKIDGKEYGTDAGYAIEGVDIFMEVFKRRLVEGEKMTREEIKDFCDMKAQMEPENEDIFKAIIKELEQEPKTGHWIEHPHEAGENWEYSKYECSECHVWEDDDSDFCPNCGVKMESEG